MEIRKNQLQECRWCEGQYIIDPQGVIRPIKIEDCLGRIKNMWYSDTQLNELGFKIYKLKEYTFEEAIQEPGTYAHQTWGLQVEENGVLVYFGDIVGGRFQQKKCGGLNVGRFSCKYVKIDD